MIYISHMWEHFLYNTRITFVCFIHAVRLFCLLSTTPWRYVLLKQQCDHGTFQTLLMDCDITFSKIYIFSLIENIISIYHSKIWILNVDPVEQIRQFFLIFEIFHHTQIYFINLLWRYVFEHFSCLVGL